MEHHAPALLPFAQWGPLRAQHVDQVDVDWSALQGFLLVDRDLSPDTVAHRLRSSRHMAAAGFRWKLYCSSPAAALVEGRRWLAWKKIHGGRSSLHNYELVLNDVARLLAQRDVGFGVVRFQHTKPLYGHPEPYSSSEWTAILGYRHAEPFVELRRRAILWFCRSTGLRRTEIARIELEDLDEDAGVLNVRRPAKRGRPRAVPLPREAWAPSGELQTYLRARGRVASSSTRLLWTSRAGRALSKHMLSKETFDISAELGFAVSFNRFRRTRATQLARAGVGLATLQALYGHSDPKSTRWYFEPTADDLRRDLERHDVDGFSKEAVQKDDGASVAL